MQMSESEGDRAKLVQRQVALHNANGSEGNQTHEWPCEAVSSGWFSVNGNGGVSSTAVMLAFSTAKANRRSNWSKEPFRQIVKAFVNVICELNFKQ